MHETADVLIIGSGLAGCLTAYCLAKEGVEVTIVTNADPLSPAIPLTQEGILYPTDEDLSELIQEEEQSAQAFDQLIKKGPAVFEEVLLKGLKIPFAKEANGEWKRAKACRQTASRCLFVNDQTEKAILDAVLAALKGFSHVRILLKHTAIQLLTYANHSKRRADLFHEPTCVGALLWDEAKKECRPLLSKETVLATGGIGQLFSHTTSTVSADGSGIGMAHQADVRLVRMDQIFFHPTTLHSQDKTRFPLHLRFLEKPIEFLNYRGAPFLDAALKPFPSKYLLDSFRQQLNSENKNLWYDLTACESDLIRKGFPSTYEYCLTKGFDMTKKALPIVPAVHFLGGGVAVDRHGRSSMHRLHAVGQAACTGVHGKEFDESVYLLESLVWAYSCAQDISNHLQKFLYPFPPLKDTSAPAEPLDPATVLHDQATIQQWMWQAIGMKQDPANQRRARSILRELRGQVEDLYPLRQPNTVSSGVRNGLLAAQKILSS